MWLLSFKTVILINILLLSLTVHHVLSTNLEPGDRAVNRTRILPLDGDTCCETEEAKRGGRRPQRVGVQSEPAGDR